MHFYLLLENIKIMNDPLEVSIKMFLFALPFALIYMVSMLGIMGVFEKKHKDKPPK